MSRPLSKTASAALLAALALAMIPAGAAAGETVAPLPSSEYAVRPACSQPRPGRASCLALQLVPVGIEAQRHTHPIGMIRKAGAAHPAVPSPKTGELGLRPQDIHSAYSLPASAPGEATVALIDAYNDPAAESDLKTYDEEFGLPPCTTENGCFKKVGEHSGSGTPWPGTVKELEEALASSNKAVKEEGVEAREWAVEISLDIESAHATCQSCKLLLVEASTQEVSDLTAAESRAEELGASEISNSWGSMERYVALSASERLPFADPHTVITASAGDTGYENWLGVLEAQEHGETEEKYTSFPAASPSVVAVGGTRLAPLGAGGAWSGESVWNGSGAGGGGCSIKFQAPSWQRAAAGWSSVGCGTMRSVSDVSADADPYSGIVVRDSDDPGAACETPYSEAGKRKYLKYWCTYGGTSLASPIIAATFALAGGSNGASYPAATLYEDLRNAPGKFHDVTSGSNGECAGGYDESTGLSLCGASEEAARSCAGTLSCLAAPGYDGPSGVGTPDGVLGFVPGQYESHVEPTAAASAPLAPAQAAPRPAPAATVTPVVLPGIELSGLGLTTPSVIALGRKPVVAKVAFHFVLNRSARVTVTLTRRVRSHNRLRWVPVGGGQRIWASAGRDLARLKGSKRLPHGTYRLTVVPSGGKPRSIAFHIG